MAPARTAVRVRHIVIAKRRCRLQETFVLIEQAFRPTSRRRASKIWAITMPSAMLLV
jgi:hypothetical protein